MPPSVNANFGALLQKAGSRDIIWLKRAATEQMKCIDLRACPMKQERPRGNAGGSLALSHAAIVLGQCQKSRTTRHKHLRPLSCEASAQAMRFHTDPQMTTPEDPELQCGTAIPQYSSQGDRRTP